MDAFIVENNHRLAEALESGRETIDADIRYLRGAEEKTGPLDPRYIFPDKRAPLPKYNLKPRLSCISNGKKFDLLVLLVKFWMIIFLDTLKQASTGYNLIMGL